MPGEGFAKRLVVLEPNRILRALFRGLLIVGPLLVFGMVTGIVPFGIFGIHLSILGALLYAGHRRHNQRATKADRQVRATMEGIFVADKLVVPQKTIADGFYQPRRQSQDEKYQSSVRIVDKRRSILFEAEMPDEREALAFLHALGLDPGSRRAEFGGGSPLFGTIGRQLLAIFGAMAATFLLSGVVGRLFHLGFAPFVMFVILPLIVAAMMPSKITVGVDGVLIRWLWTKKFIPMKDIRGVSEADDNAIRFHLRSGEERVVYTSMRHKQSNVLLMQNNRDAILARVREAHQTWASGGAAVDALPLVARGTQKRSDWLAALEKLALHGGGYRDAVVRDEDLLRVVEDPHAPEDARAGAALVLRKTADDETKARVRVAAEASASPKLRVALDAAAVGSDEKIDAAMSDLVPEEEEREQTIR